MGVHGKEVPSKRNFVLEIERLRKFIYSEDRETPVEFRSSFQLSCVESAILIFYMTFYSLMHFFDFSTIAFNLPNSVVWKQTLYAVISEIYFLSFYICVAYVFFCFFTYLIWSVKQSTTTLFLPNHLILLIV